MQIDIPTGDDQMKISFEPRKRKAQEELEEERPAKYRQVNEVKEIRQTEEELMKIDEENQNQLMIIDQLRQLQETASPDIMQGIVDNIAHLKLQIYDQEQYIRKRFNAWNEKRKIIIQFKKHKQIAE